MTNWTLPSLIEFFNKYSGFKIKIEDPNTLFMAVGVITGVEELDLCNHYLPESLMKLSNSYVEISVTLHTDFLGMHIMVYAPDKETIELSFPYQIPYTTLQVTLLEKE